MGFIGVLRGLVVNAILRDTKTETIAVLLAVALMLMSGCETLNPVTVGFGIVSYATTGKGLADHAIGKLTQKDCNILGGILSAERKICEPLGSAAAQRGFKGFFDRSIAVVDDEGTQLRLSENIAKVRPGITLTSLEPFLLQTPVLRLSDTIESSSEKTLRTPDRLAAAMLAPSTLAL